MAKNVLSARLRKLVEHGVLKLVPARDGGARQEYSLTERGLSLFTIMVALRQWGEMNLCEAGEIDFVLVDRKNRQPVRQLEVRSSTGRLLKVSDLELVSPDDVMDGRPKIETAVEAKLKQLAR